MISYKIILYKSILYLFYVKAVINFGNFMIKCIFFLFITLTLVGCNINNKMPHFSETVLDRKYNNSYSANYLTANYSINKGDAYTASQILDKNFQSPK